MKIARGTMWRSAWLRYGLLAGLVLLVATVATVTVWHQREQRYVLDAAELKLIGKSSVENKRIEDSTTAVSYNRAEETSAQASATVTLASTAMDSTGQAPYRATLSKDNQAGVTFGDASGDMSFKMVPQFDVATGKYQDGRLVFPEGNNRTHVYSFKRNGIKEDIILTKAPGDTARYSWKLELDSALQAKLLPNGEVGIYSANPLLLNNSSGADANTKSVLDIARSKSEKTHLVFILPAPYIKDANDKSSTKDVSFKLDGNILTLEARNLKNKNYPLSIDPTAVVTTTADFRSGWDDGMIDYSTADQITRSSVSLGALGSATQQTAAFTTARNGHASVTYKGYLYIVGGNDGTNALNDIQYCPINSGGSIGTCTQQAAAFTTARAVLAVAVYNGTLYISGGQDNSSNPLNDVIYCPFKATGSVDTCTQQAAAFAAPRYAHTSVAYNGYLYIIGGARPAFINDIQYCPINAGGSIGTCTQQLSAFTTARAAHSSVVYNGYLYIIGGLTSGTVTLNDIQYCPINASGSVGTCTQQASAFTSARQLSSSVVYDGYIYVIGGFSGGTRYDDIQYLPITTGTTTGFGSVGTSVQQAAVFTTARTNHASVASDRFVYISGGTDISGALNDIIYCGILSTGAIGTCTQQTNAFTTARSYHTMVTYNGYMYIVGGSDGTNALNDIQYCPINVNGSVGTCTQQTNAFTTARSSQTTVIYNGYLYIIGGVVGGVSQSDIQYCPLNSNGSVGTCIQQTSALVGGRATHASAVYNGYLYVTGGIDNTPVRTDDIQYCPLNSNGSVGTCIQQTSAFTTARGAHTTVAIDGYLYIIGGLDTSSTRLNDIQYCPLNSNGSVGTCIQQTSAFTDARNGHTSVAASGNIYIIGGTTTTRQNDIVRVPVLTPDISGRYDKIIDLGRVADTFDSLSFNGQSKCSIQLLYVTAGSDGIFGASNRIVGPMPGTTYALSGEASKRYMRIAIFMDDSTCGTASNITDITLSYTKRALTPTLYTPVNNVTGTTYLPQFTLRSPDDESDYIRYKIEVCSNADCSSVLRTIDQTSSQTGWSGQDQQTGTAYTGNPVLTSSTMATHTYQTPALSAGTQYWWRGYAINPAEANTWSFASAIQTFTTNSVPAAPTLLAPIPSSTDAGLLVDFRLRTTDADSDYLQYKFQLCANSSCSSVISTYDQTSSQTNWSNQNAGTSNITAYTSSTVLANSREARYRLFSATLTPQTQYWWRAYAIDPAGSNTFSAASSIATFTTAQYHVNITGGTSINGNTKIFN